MDRMVIRALIPLLAVAILSADTRTRPTAKRQDRLISLEVAPPPPLKGYSNVICPTWGPCWQGGKPIVGALGRQVD